MIFILPFLLTDSVIRDNIWAFHPIFLNYPFFVSKGKCIVNAIMLKKGSVKSWINLRQKFSTASVNVLEHQLKGALPLLMLIN